MKREINQCDGCRRGMPMNEHGLHRNPVDSWDMIGCTAYRYKKLEVPSLAELVEKFGDWPVPEVSGEARKK